MNNERRGVIEQVESLQQSEADRRHLADVNGDQHSQLKALEQRLLELEKNPAVQSDRSTQLAGEHDRLR